MPPVSECWARGLTIAAARVTAAPAPVMMKSPAPKVGHFQTKGGGAFVETIGSALTRWGRGFGRCLGTTNGSCSGSVAGAGAPSSGERGADWPGAVTSTGYGTGSAARAGVASALQAMAANSAVELGRAVLAAKEERGMWDESLRAGRPTAFTSSLIKPS